MRVLRTIDLPCPITKMESILLGVAGEGYGHNAEVRINNGVVEIVAPKEDA